MLDEVQVVAPTEERNARSMDLDRRSSLEVLQLLNDADAQVAPAVAATLPVLARLVDATVERIRRGGTVHYAGAGTSGRLAVLDAAELRPTFNVTPGLVVAHHAGGRAALVDAVEGVEDDVAAGAADLSGVGPDDVVVGLTASGRTPYVRGALTAARERGALTALVTSNPRAELAALADLVVAPDTGAEVVTGSTRLKAGTAQKLVLNGFSTAVMVRLGHTFENLMVDVVATNAKLRGRVVRILCEAAGVDEPEAAARSPSRTASSSPPSSRCSRAPRPPPPGRARRARRLGRRRPARPHPARRGRPRPGPAVGAARRRPRPGRVAPVE